MLRLSLACLTLRRHRIEIEAAVDYGISQAISFSDPDGNGIELYVDMRREGRPLWQGTTARLNLDALPAEAGTGSPGGQPGPTPAHRPARR
jgi:catechol-2,3-dioxygenase